LQRKIHYVSPKEMAHIVGVVRSASDVAPWGTFLSFNLENSLRLSLRNMIWNPRVYWNRHKIFLSHVAVDTINQLMETLLAPEGDPHWTRPLALYMDRHMDRDPTHAVFSDASYVGLGGWSADFSFFWRLSREDLIQHGFDMKFVDRARSEPVDPASSGLHINPLEFIAALLNMWISLWIVDHSTPLDGGFVIQLNSDNTTALSWMSVAARTPDPALQGLARVGSAFLVKASTFLTKILPEHIPGDQNNIADALSRPTIQGKENSLDSVICKWSQLRTCRRCQFPSNLLRRLASLISSRQTGVQYEAITTELLTQGPRFLSNGATNSMSLSNTYEQ